MLKIPELNPLPAEVLAVPEPVAFVGGAESYDLPLCAARGEEAELLVELGQEVEYGQAVAMLESGESVSAPVSGQLAEIVMVKLPAVGKIPCARILPNKLTEEAPIWPNESQTVKPVTYKADEILSAAKRAGITEERSRQRLATVLTTSPKGAWVCAAAYDDQPFTAANRLLFRRYMPQIIEGLQLCAVAAGGARIALALPEDYPLPENFPNDITVFPLPTNRYPGYGAIKKQLSGRSLCLLGVQALLALYRAALSGTPQTGVIVTVWGDTMESPKQLYAHYGTPVYQVCQQAGVTGEVDRVVAGGVMNGSVISINSVIAPGITELTVLNKATPQHPVSCVGCGRCISACPERLMPLYIMQAYEQNDYLLLKQLNASQCSGCGSCGYICPAHTGIGAFLPQIAAKMKMEGNAQ